MLKSIRIRNFHCHRDTLLELSPGVNALVGDTTSGKTDVLRAICWLAFGDFPGEGVRSTFAPKDESTSVTIVLQDSTTITKSRSASGKVKYTLEAGEEIRWWEGAAVPDDVTEALRLDRQNFFMQLDPHFLVGSSPVEAARLINRAIKADDGLVIQASLVNESNTLRREERLIREGVEAAVKRIETLGPGYEAERLVGMGEAQLQKRHDIRDRRDRLEELKNYSRKFSTIIQREAAPAMEAAALLNSADSALKASQKARTLSAEISAIRSRCGWLHKLQSVTEIGLVGAGLSAAERVLEEREALSEKAEDLLRVVTAAEERARLTQEAAISAERYIGLLREAKTCPVCSTTMDGAVLKQVLKQLGG